MDLFDFVGYSCRTSLRFYSCMCLFLSISLSFSLSLSVFLYLCLSQFFFLSFFLILCLSLSIPPLLPPSVGSLDIPLLLPLEAPAAAAVPPPAPPAPTATSWSCSAVSASMRRSNINSCSCLYNARRCDSGSCFCSHSLPIVSFGKSIHIPDSASVLLVSLLGSCSSAWVVGLIGKHSWELFVITAFVLAF